jgi:hypothetical protein
MNATLDNGNPGRINLEELNEKIRLLESRISRLELHVDKGGYISSPVNGEQKFASTKVIASDDEVILVGDAAIESNVLEYGLAGFGSIILIFGLIFLMIFLQKNLTGIVSGLIGYGAVAGVFLFAYYFRKSFYYLSYMFNVSGHLLAYYVTLRLHFFTPQPAISSEGMALILLLIVVAGQIYFGVKRNSEFLAALGIILLLLTGIFADKTHLTLPVAVLTGIVAMFLFIKYNWRSLFTLSLILIYATHFIWLLNNPIMGHNVGGNTFHDYNLIYLFFYGAIFSYTPLIKNKGLFPNGFYSSTIILNGISFSLVIFFVVLKFYQESYTWIFLLIAFFCLLYSIYLKFKLERKFDPAFYACFGFFAISIAVYGYAKLPGAYFLLIWQSLLVVSIALWYRSKIIVLANTGLFAGIMLIYLLSSPSVDRINFSLAIIGLATARIINWQKERLILKTDSIRNFYLVTVFFSSLYALYHAFPKEYVTISWSAAAFVYFMLSIFLKNSKYRWMAVLTLGVTAIYLFVIDLAHMGVGYRVVAFLFLAIISLGASLYYTKKVRAKHQTDENLKIDGKN